MNVIFKTLKNKVPMLVKQVVLPYKCNHFGLLKLHVTAPLKQVRSTHTGGSIFTNIYSDVRATEISCNNSVL